MGLEERLKSRFGWGLTVAVEPPELETRVAILMKKATEAQDRVAPGRRFLYRPAHPIQCARARRCAEKGDSERSLRGRPIDIDLIKESLKDLLALQDKQVSMDNISSARCCGVLQDQGGGHDVRRRSRSVARPRQMAMALAKELTNHSLPEIGDSFGGRDHTTVLHACRKIKELRETNSDIREDYKNLLRSLTT